jgi:Protein of unknown function (DUF3298)
MKMYLRLLTLCIFLLVLVACGGNPAITPEPTVPIGLPVTPVPFYLTVTLGSTPYSESGTGPVYTIETNTPVLTTGNLDPRLGPFNDQMVALVQQEVDAFKQNLQMASVEPIVGGSSLEINFSQLSPQGNILSLKFTIYFYFDGAAHPNTYTRTATYDLEAGKMLALADLFLPAVDYLALISTYCLEDLRAGPFGEALFEEGAQPTEENYARWNITPEGLLITFDPYQVTAYAAGPQLVVIPYSELQSIIDPQGPIEEFLP